MEGLLPAAQCAFHLIQEPLWGALLVISESWRCIPGLHSFQMVQMKRMRQDRFRAVGGKKRIGMGAPRYQSQQKLSPPTVILSSHFLLEQRVAPQGVQGGEAASGQSWKTRARKEFGEWPAHLTVCDLQCDHVGVIVFTHVHVFNQSTRTEHLCVLSTVLGVCSSDRQTNPMRPMGPRDPRWNGGRQEWGGAPGIYMEHRGLALSWAPGDGEKTDWGCVWVVGGQKRGMKNDS